MHDDRLIEPPLEIVPYLRQAGFYGAARIGQFEYDPNLVTALVERWRPETHTFHTTRGECTITLQDVAIQLGLPCDGLAVIGGTGLDWLDMCESLLGIRPPEDKIYGQRLFMCWLAEHFDHLPENADDEHIRQFTRAYILRLIGGYLMPDRSGARVYLMYLPLLIDFEQAGRYSWGSAVLSYLYRELCNATRINEQNIGGCLTLLHLWAWDRFPKLAIGQPQPPSPHLDVYHFPPPLGFRWRHVGRAPRPVSIALHHYRSILDGMADDDIIWEPYQSPAVQQFIPQYCLHSPQIWRASVPLICFHIIEWHHPDRVLRQFGRHQPIPAPPVDLEDVHELQLRGKTTVNWFDRHIMFIQSWLGWRDAIADAPLADGPLDRTSEYMQWYWRHTRRWIHPSTAAPGFAADIAEDLYKLSINDPLPMPTTEYQQRVVTDQRNILLALREQRFTLNPQPAPSAIELPRPEIPPGRRTRRRHGNPSTRPSITPENEQQQPHTTFSTMGSPSSSFHAPTPTQVPLSWSQHDYPAPNQFGPFTSSFEDPLLFMSESTAYPHTFEHGESSHNMFVTPQQSIPPPQSPMFDLNTPQIEQINEEPQSHHEEQIDQGRPHRVRRRPRCGTGGHYE